MTRKPIALLIVLALAAVVFADLGASEPLNPYRAPPAIALGSGQAVSGAHCSALPK